MAGKFEVALAEQRAREAATAAATAKVIEAKKAAVAQEGYPPEKMAELCEEFTDSVRAAAIKCGSDEDTAKKLKVRFREPQEHVEAGVEIYYAEKSLNTKMPKNLHGYLKYGDPKQGSDSVRSVFIEGSPKKAFAQLNANLKKLDPSLEVELPPVVGREIA